MFIRDTAKQKQKIVNGTELSIILRGENGKKVWAATGNKLRAKNGKTNCAGGKGKQIAWTAQEKKCVVLGSDTGDKSTLYIT